MSDGGYLVPEEWIQKGSPTPLPVIITSDDLEVAVNSLEPTARCLEPERLEVKVGRIEINIDGTSNGYLKVDGVLIKNVCGFSIEAKAGEQPVVVCSLVP